MKVPPAIGRKIPVCACMALMIMAVSIPYPHAVQARESEESPYVSGEFLAKFKAGVSPERIRVINHDLGVKVINYFERIRVYHLGIEDTRTVEEMVKIFSGLPEVEYAEPNYRQRALPEK